MTGSTNGEALRQQAERLPELERPTILVGDISELEYLLTLRDEEDIRFDRIIGRNLFTAFAANATHQELIRMLDDRLLRGGRLCLVQTIARHGQRLYNLVDWSNASAALAGKVRVAEEGIYTDETDPLVNWDERDLESAMRASGLAHIQVQIEQQPGTRRITGRHLSRWFEEDKVEDDRPSYGQRLLNAGLTQAELEQVSTLYRRQLVDQMVSWSGTIAYLVAHQQS